MLPVDSNEVVAQREQAIIKARDDTAKSILAARAAFLKEHPDDPFTRAITDGRIVLGMNSDEVDAAGFGCEVKETSALGDVESCVDDMKDAYAIVYGQRSPPIYVAFDADGKVVSINYQ